MTVSERTRQLAALVDIGDPGTRARVRQAWGRRRVRMPRLRHRRGVRRSRNILVYHRVADVADDPFTLCVSPARFARQMELLADVADVVRLDQILTVGDRPKVSVTFDDGYADNLTHALPIVESLGIPITVFVPSRALGRDSGFWWDRLAETLCGRNEVRAALELPGAPLRVDARGPGAGRRVLHLLAEQLRSLPPTVIDEFVDTLAAQLGARSAAPGTGPLVPERAASQTQHWAPGNLGTATSSRARTLDVPELRALAASPLVTIGAHTTDHVRLRFRPAAEQHATISASKAELEDLLGVEVHHFAYPFGDAASFDRASVQSVARAGFATACTTVDGRVTRWSNRLLLPRRMVQNWDETTFGSRLEWWRIV